MTNRGYFDGRNTRFNECRIDLLLSDRFLGEEKDDAVIWVKFNFRGDRFKCYLHCFCVFFCNTGSLKSASPGLIGKETDDPDSD